MDARPTARARSTSGPARPTVVLADLDRVAPEALTTGLPARLVGAVDELLAADLDGHPWSQLLAAAACHDAHRGDPRALELFESAWAGFEGDGDREALGVAANVRANLALGQGDIAEAVRWWERAEELLGRSGDIAISVAAHRSLAAYAGGDLVGAEQGAREALLLADKHGSSADALVPMVYLALYAFCLGDIARSRQILQAARAVIESVEPGVRNEGALVLGFSGVIEAVRGNRVEADRFFLEALAWAEADAAPWYASIVRILRAAFTARWAPHRSLADARAGLAGVTAMGDVWWQGLARNAEGTALAELGDLEAARAVLEDAAGMLSNPVERAFCQLELGEALLGLGDRSAARTVLEDARLAFERAGARYWATRVNLALGSADRARGRRWLRLARSAAVDDPAYDRLFAPGQELRIDVLGRPAVRLDGNDVEFLTRHAELATYLLAVAGGGGLPADELASTLWPGVDARRTGPRLRTLLWQVRNALGREAWRVQRRRGSVLLDLTGVEVDLHQARLAGEERAALDGTDGATPPVWPPPELLPGWEVTLPPTLSEPPPGHDGSGGRTGR